MYLSLENVLDKVREEDIYLTYIGIAPQLKEYFKVPWRADKSPSLKFFHHMDKSRTTKLWWRDLTKDVSGDCINAMQNMLDLPFYDCLIKINNDFKLGLYTKYQSSSITQVAYASGVQSEEFEITHELNVYNGKHIFTKTDLKYFEKRCISKEQLIESNTFSVNKVFKNGKAIWHYHKNNPIFLYVDYVDGIAYNKYYRPLEENRKFKWLSNHRGVSTKILDGSSILPLYDDILVVTKSRKDRLVLNALGYNSINLQSEAVFCDKDIWDKESFHSRFRIVYSLFDNDSTGIEMGNKFANKFDTIPIFLPNEYGKDIDEVIVNYGREETEMLLNSIL